jgi:hypothetical protein
MRASRVGVDRLALKALVSHCESRYTSGGCGSEDTTQLTFWLNATEFSMGYNSMYLRRITTRSETSIRYVWLCFILYKFAQLNSVFFKRKGKKEKTVVVT